MTPSVSIIICTCNRAGDLCATLESVGRVSVPSGWVIELLVVDNGSTDATEAAVARLKPGGFPLRLVKEPRKGKGYAYNTGLATARHDIFLFTDDDVRVPENWIAGMCRPIAAGESDAVAGGVVFPPRLSFALSQDAFKSRRSWFASTDYLDPDRPAAMIGANMAFHRRILAQVPGFDPELGPGALGFEDETLFSKQLQLAGYRLTGALATAVEHHFDASRATRAGLLDLARKRGRSNAFVFHHWEHDRSRLIVPRLGIFLLRRAWARRWERRRPGQPEDVSDAVLCLEEKVAFSREYLIQRRRPHKYSRRGLVPHDFAVPR